jgi:hypothetical protein
MYEIKRLLLYYNYHRHSFWELENKSKSNPNHYDPKKVHLQVDTNTCMLQVSKINHVVDFQLASKRWHMIFFFYTD